MANIICVRPIWDREALPMPRKLQYRRGDRLHPVKFFPVHVGPEPDHPVGRKGHVLARAWEQLRGSPPADGLLILDGDVAVDPEHTRAMIEAIDSDCTRVWTAPVRIWPVSTHRQDWVWAHWEDHASQELDMFPRYFSFSFTYLPAGLVDKAIRGGMKTWHYPHVDSSMSRVARDHGFKAQMVEDCFPVHMHWA